MCRKSIDLNPDDPNAYMLMALILTAQGDNKSAIDFVENALLEFPSNYGLFVLRLKLEALRGYNEEVLNMSRDLIYFWRKTRTVVNNLIFETDEKIGETKANSSDISKRASTSIFSADQSQTIHKIVMFYSFFLIYYFKLAGNTNFDSSDRNIQLDEPLAADFLWE